MGFYCFKLPLLWLLRFYFQYFPIRTGKDYIWQKLHGRRGRLLLETEIPARLKTGAIIQGNLHDAIHCQVFFFGVWERDLSAYYRKVLRQGDIVIDIGAHVGTHALLAAHLVGPTGRVHAIEASPAIFKQLKRNLEINHAQNVTAYNFAVIDHTERTPTFSYADFNSGRASILYCEEKEFTPGAMVDGRPLPDIVPMTELRSARILKIDVEGSEWLVIKGFADILPQLRQDAEIIVEVTIITLKDFAIPPAVFLDTFERHGFVPWMLTNDYYPFPRDGELIPMLCKDCQECQIVFRRDRSSPKPINQ